MITEWDKLINRIKLESNTRLNRHTNGGTPRATAIGITVKILVDCEGNPLTWIVESKDIEPLARARALLDLL